MSDECFAIHSVLDGLPVPKVPPPGHMLTLAESLHLSPALLLYLGQWRRHTLKMKKARVVLAANKQ